MRNYAIIGFLLLIASLALYGFGGTQTDQIDAKRLRSMLVQMGHDVKDLNTEAGKERYEVKVVSGGYDVFVAFEVSKSKNYVWLTVLLGDAPAESSPKALAMLKETSNIQPTMFYVTSANKLMLGLPVEQSRHHQCGIEAAHGIHCRKRWQDVCPVGKVPNRLNSQLDETLIQQYRAFWLLGGAVPGTGGFQDAVRVFWLTIALVVTHRV